MLIVMIVPIIGVTDWQLPIILIITIITSMLIVTVITGYWPIPYNRYDHYNQNSIGYTPCRGYVDYSQHTDCND